MFTLVHWFGKVFYHNSFKIKNSTIFSLLLVRIDSDTAIKMSLKMSPLLVFIFTRFEQNSGVHRYLATLPFPWGRRAIHFCSLVLQWSMKIGSHDAYLL
jgi:hypothetical protein